MRAGFVLQQLWIQHTVYLIKALPQWEQLLASVEVLFHMNTHKKNSTGNCTS